MHVHALVMHDPDTSSQPSGDSNSRQPERNQNHTNYPCQANLWCSVVGPASVTETAISSFTTGTAHSPDCVVQGRVHVQTSSQARTILRQMEDGKLLSGQDYSTSALVSLRQTCADSGAVVKAQTPCGGDAIFRAGVEAAASAAMEAGQGASLGGASPPRFVSGLANDLGKGLLSQVAVSCLGLLHCTAPCLFSELLLPFLFSISSSIHAISNLQEGDPDRQVVSRSHVASPCTV